MAGNVNVDFVKVRAKSPGNGPILVVELPSGELRTTYYETDYELSTSKPVSEEWLQENALGRHSFVALDRPEEVATEALGDYVRRELPAGS
ncbi:hypothetical protein BH23ACT11_BH23ACT11_07780 [soil metagenome]